MKGIGIDFEVGGETVFAAIVKVNLFKFWKPRYEVVVLDFGASTESFFELKNRDRITVFAEGQFFPSVVAEATRIANGCDDA